MEKLLKPGQLAIDPNSPTAGKGWKHWVRRFEDYVSQFTASKSEDEAEAYKLSVLVNYADTEVYEYFDHCKTYSEAKAVLQELYVKEPSEIFARYVLLTSRQKADQSLADFRCALNKLAKDCNFASLTATQHKDSLLRDAFIAGISSSEIRQRLLENKTLTYSEAYSLSVTFDDARKNNLRFGGSPNVKLESTMAAGTDNLTSGSLEQEVDQSVAAIDRASGVCVHCGNSRPHDFKRCKAKAVICFNCGQKGHFSRACRAKRNTSGSSSKTRDKHLATMTGEPYLSCNITKATASMREENSVVTCAEIKGRRYRAMLDTGSHKCFVDSSIAKELGIKATTPFRVGLAQSTNKVGISGVCIVDLKMLGNFYKSVKLYVMDDLCENIVVGRELLNLHNRVIFRLGGERGDLEVPETKLGAVRAANIETPSLFANLRADCKPIATRSRRFNQEARNFISSTVAEWEQSGTIRPSNSPWRAQCVVVKSGKRIERLAIDYSQTINLFTEKDSFPIPLIEDIINQLAVFKFYASYDLRKAYHQVPIPEKDKPFTAFEACGQLWEFNVIPFGVTNGGPVFQRIMTNLIKHDSLEDTFVYFDNIVIGAASLSELKTKSSKFLNSIKQRGMTLNDSKTVYGVQELGMLGYCIGNKVIKPDPERLKPLLEFPPPTSVRSLKRALGLFAYYAKWVPEFSDRISRLKLASTFPLGREELQDFEELKRLIAASALKAIDESLPFVVECDASEVAVSATLNQGGRPVAFMSRSFSGSELAYPAVEKEATAIIEAVRKWSHLLMRQQFTLVTDQRSVAFMLDMRKKTKVKSNKILCWRLELSSFAYTIHYRPGRLNVAADALTRATCSAVRSPTSMLDDIHKQLCCPGITRLWHYVRVKNLPYSLENVKKTCSRCETCAEIKPQFYSAGHNVLIKATQPMERLSIDFKGPLPSSSRNSFFLCVVDEYSRYPFCFPCADTSTSTVIKCLKTLFSLFGTCQCIHSDRGSSFSSRQMKEFLLQNGIASSFTTPYHPQGNAQCERYNGIIWRTIKCALRSRHLPTKKWESVISVALDSIRSLLCTSTGETPHSRFFCFNRRSSHGNSLPEWLSRPGTVLLRKFVRTGKNDDVVQKVELVEANPMYARIKYPDGRETNVSLRDLARYPQGQEQLREDEVDDGNDRRDELNDEGREGLYEERRQAHELCTEESEEGGRESEDGSRVLRNNCDDPRVTPEDPTSDLENHESPEPRVPGSPELRRSERRSKGIPPDRFGF